MTNNEQNRVAGRHVRLIPITFTIITSRFTFTKVIRERRLHINDIVWIFFISKTCYGNSQLRGTKPFRITVGVQMKMQGKLFSFAFLRVL